MKKSVLKNLGLSNKEIEIYLATVSFGPAPVARIAREAQLPRQTVYSIMTHLLEHGFVEQSDRRGVKNFFADPKKLLLLLDRRRKEIDTHEHALEKELPKLLALQQRVIPLPAVRYYEGEEGLRGQLDDILEVYRKGGEKKFRGYGINRFHEVLGDYLYAFVKKRHSYGVTTDLFIAEGEDDFGIVSEEERYGREIKHIAMKPKDAGMYVVGDRVYFFSYADNVGVMIENRAIVDLLKDVFDDHWRKSDNS